MRTHHFGVLVQGRGPVKLQGPANGADPGSAQAPAVGEAPAARSPTPTAGDDSQIDVRSGQDLVAALTGLGHPATLLYADETLDLQLRAAGVTACLLATHGALGGSGELQGLLRLRAIPFAGPSAAAAALAFDKLRARQILGFHSLPVPATLALHGDAPLDRHSLGLLGWPCVLKPRCSSLGVGVTHLDDAASVALAAEAHQGSGWLLERAVPGREIQVVVLDGRVLGAMEVERDPGNLRQISAMVCPPAMSRSRRHGIDNLATHAVAALGLTRGAARVDLMMNERHNEVILEVEPLPPLHRDGVVAKVALAAGLRYEQLVAALVHDMVEVPLRRATPRVSVEQTLGGAALQ